jgi:hypothetical protein
MEKVIANNVDKNVANETIKPDSIAGYTEANKPNITKTIRWVENSLRDITIIGKSLIPVKDKNGVTRYKDLGTINLIHHDIRSYHNSEYVRSDYAKLIAITINSSKEFNNDNLKPQLIKLLGEYRKYIGDRLITLEGLYNNFLRKLAYIILAYGCRPDDNIHNVNDIIPNTKGYNGSNFDEVINLAWSRMSANDIIEWLINGIDRFDGNSHRIKSMARCYIGFLNDVYMSKRYQERESHNSNNYDPTIVTDLKGNINVFDENLYVSYMRSIAKLNRVPVSVLMNTGWLETIFYKVIDNDAVDFNQIDELTLPLDNNGTVVIPSKMSKETMSEDMLGFIGQLNKTQRYFKENHVLTTRYHNMFYLLYKPYGYNEKSRTLKVQLGTYVDENGKDTMTPCYYIWRENKFN